MSIGVMTSVRRVVAIGVVGVASVLGGCGDDASEKTVDATKLEHEIEQSLSTTTTKVSSASCPDDVKNETGTKFACKAQLSGGGSARVAVTITRAPNQFSYSFKPGTVVLAGAAIDTALERDLAASGVADATVNCPAKIEVKAGTTVTCPVAGAGGGVGSVSFQFTDATGSIDSSSVKAAS